MKYTLELRRVVAGAFACAGPFVLATLAVAAPPDRDLGDVIVQSARPATHVVGRSDLGAPITVIELRYRVRYSDLDLRTPNGAATLRQRVEAAADTACRELDRLYPLEAKDPKCASTAAHDAQAQIDAAITAAGTR